MTDTIERRFESIEWHDAVLLNLDIDRCWPGKRDEVLLLVEWPDERKQKVRFVDCYAFEAQMNFGLMAPESIRVVRCIADMPKLTDMRQRWKELGVALEDLRCFEITTNSTASEIRIYARQFEIADS